MAWVLQSGIFYYGVRKYIFESPVLEDKKQMISDALDVFLAGFEQVFSRRRRVRKRVSGCVGLIASIPRSSNYALGIAARYQSPISLAVIRATPSWPMT